MSATSSPRHRYYQVVFIRMKDPPKFRRYLELVAPIVGRYGGGLERMLSPEAIYAEGIAKPDTINIVSYDSPAAFGAFTRDPDFLDVVHLRSESIDMVAVGGRSVGGEVTDAGLAERVYTVEIARFGPGGAQGYRAYEEQAGPTLQRYGCHVERVVAPDTASGLSFTPDIVKVGYSSAFTLLAFRKSP